MPENDEIKWNQNKLVNMWNEWEKLMMFTERINWIIIWIISFVPVTCGMPGTNGNAASTTSTTSGWTEWDAMSVYLLRTCFLEHLMSRQDQTSI